MRACLSLLALAAATSGQEMRLMHEAPACVLAGAPCDSHDWAREGRAPRGAEGTYMFAIQQRNLAELDRVFHEVSDPTHVNYGRHLSRKEIQALTTDDTAARAVEGWLRAQGRAVRVTQNDGDYVTAKMPFEVAEALFATEIFTFRSAQNGGRVVHRALRYSLPTDVAGRVSFVTHLTQFPSVAGALQEEPLLTGGGTPDAVIPQTLSALYGIGSDRVAHGTQIAVFKLDPLNFAPDDLAKYIETFKLDTPPEVSVEGQNDASQCADTDVGKRSTCYEPNLDVQYALGVAQGANVTVFSTDFSSQTGHYLDFLVALSQMDDPPSVASISYAEPEAGLDEAMMIRFNEEAKKLGARGVSIIVASGDRGVLDKTPTTCAFTPLFPASSPYVTTVGGTLSPPEGGEVACTPHAGSIISTGGGFSERFAQPGWQNSSVAGYLDQFPEATGFNSTGRAYPDVSALANRYIVMIGGNLTIISGTSAATPAFAGMVALINDARKGQSLPPVGFLNPQLYQMGGHGFYDITQGENNCNMCPEVAEGLDHCMCCDKGVGFVAAGGWDPLTGLGSPQFQSLKGIFGVSTDGGAGGGMSWAVVAALVLGGLVLAGIVSFLVVRRARARARDAPGEGATLL